MKNNSKFILLVSLLVLSSTLFAIDVRNMTFTPLHNMILPKVDKSILPNGITLYLCEDHTLPVVNVRGIVRTGDVFDPADKLGLAAMTGDLIQSGGAGKYSAKDLDQLLDERGRELYLESWRKQDLIRFGKYLVAWQEKAASDPKFLYFPIPNGQLAANPNLTQNPGF